jgi:hypothetical protein
MHCFPRNAARLNAAKRHDSRSILVHLELPERPAGLEVWAYDLSESGIGLNLPHPLELGSAVVLDFRGWMSAQWVTMSARVVHATKQDESTWRIGCQFERRLDRKTLQALLPFAPWEDASGCT